MKNIYKLVVPFSYVLFVNNISFGSLNPKVVYYPSLLELIKDADTFSIPVTSDRRKFLPLNQFSRLFDENPAFNDKDGFYRLYHAWSQKVQDAKAELKELNRVLQSHCKNPGAYFWKRETPALTMPANKATLLLFTNKATLLLPANKATSSIVMPVNIDKSIQDRFTELINQLNPIVKSMQRFFPSLKLINFLDNLTKCNHIIHETLFVRINNLPKCLDAISNAMKDAEVILAQVGNQPRINISLRPILHILRKHFPKEDEDEDNIFFRPMEELFTMLTFSYDLEEEECRDDIILSKFLKSCLYHTEAIITKDSADEANATDILFFVKFNTPIGFFANSDEEMFIIKIIFEYNKVLQQLRLKSAFPCSEQKFLGEIKKAQDTIGLVFSRDE
ncbi:MAG: hypothetical protein LBS71_01870 [Puniceicoccales bacterium]|jgi:hypothetical protein|nr:hypothetical protein [Puniceicoccales bacterium]